MTSTVTHHTKAFTVTLWTVQILIAVFFLAAAAGPKLFGEPTAVAIFDELGSGQWFRYAIGVIELAGAIGLLIPRLSGLAAAGLTGLMIGATITQLVWLDGPVVAITPAVLGVVVGTIAWLRRAEIRALFVRR